MEKATRSLYCDMCPETVVLDGDDIAASWGIVEHRFRSKKVANSRVDLCPKCYRDLKAYMSRKIIS